jgi:DNA-directed RNA polymerase subunit M/transcription elongation factor TFIIS
MLFSGFTPSVPVSDALTPEIRTRALRSLHAALGGTEAGAAARADPARALAIEFGIAMWSECRTRPYARKLYSVLWALRHPPSAEMLLARCEPCEVAFVREDTMMKHEEAGEGNAAVAALQARLDALEAALKTRLTAPRRSCPRCGCKDMERIALQLRAADEGMTTMLQCTQCSQRIRI